MTALVLPVLIAIVGTILTAGLHLAPVRAADLIAAVGLSYLLGASATGAATCALLAAGVGLIPAFISACCACATGGLVLRRFTGGDLALARPVADGGTRELAVATGAAAAVIAVVGLAVAIGHPFRAWDAWSIWGRKALALANSGELDPQFYANRALAFMHPSYPIGVPVIEALEVRLGGLTDGIGAITPLWLMVPAYVGAAAFVASRVTGMRSWAPVLIALLVVPGCYREALNGYADVPVAVMVGSATLFAAAWISTNHAGLLIAAAIMLAGAVNAKNEGLLGAVVVLGAVAIARPRGTGSPVWILLAAASGFVALAYLPWRLWCLHHGVPGELPLARGLDPTYVIGRRHRAWVGGTALEAQVISSSSWRGIVPAGLVIAAAGCFVSELRRVALFHVGVLAAFFAGLVWVYCISPEDLRFLVGGSANRIVATLVFVSTSAVVMLGGAARRSR